MDLNEPLFDGISANEWRKELIGQDPWVRRHFFATLALFGTPESYLDIGCGTGITVFTALQLGIPSFGVDQIITPDYDQKHFFHHDLREPFSPAQHQLPPLYQMVTSLEVAEHIPEDRHNIFCDSVANPLQKGGFLIFTAAHPGQGGINHLSERPAGYWRDQFHQRGLTYRRDYTIDLALLWKSFHSPLNWLPANLQVFER